MDPTRKIFLQSHINDLVKLARRGHYYCDEDTWYSCPAHPEGCADDRQPKGVCNCGADAHNAEVCRLADLLQSEIA